MFSASDQKWLKEPDKTIEILFNMLLFVARRQELDHVRMKRDACPKDSAHAPAFLDWFLFCGWIAILEEQILWAVGSDEGKR